MDKKKLHDYFLELKELFKSEKISPNDLLQVAKDFVVHENISLERKQMPSRPQQSQQQSTENMMTEKQKNYLEKEKIRIPEEGFTKNEASKLIGEIIERKKKSKSQEQNSEDYNY